MDSWGNFFDAVLALTHKKCEVKGFINMLTCSFVSNPEPPKRQWLPVLFFFFQAALQLFASAEKRGREGDSSVASDGNQNQSLYGQDGGGVKDTAKDTLERTMLQWCHSFTGCVRDALLGIAGILGIPEQAGGSSRSRIQLRFEWTICGGYSRTIDDPTRAYGRAAQYMT